MSSVRRCLLEITTLQKHGAWDVLVEESNPFDFKVVCPGPKDTPYAPYTLTFLFQLPSAYPFQPPMVPW